MRITGGAACGIQLAAPKGDGTRPATDQMREALFSSLGTRIEGARIADLFAGTGSYGLEAMSRGASGGIFVENSSVVVACLKKNLSAVSKAAAPKKVIGVSYPKRFTPSPKASDLSTSSSWIRPTR